MCAIIFVKTPEKNCRWNGAPWKRYSSIEEILWGDCADAQSRGAKYREVQITTKRGKITREIWEKHYHLDESMMYTFFEREETEWNYGMYFDFSFSVIPLHYEHLAFKALSDLFDQFSRPSKPAFAGGEHYPSSSGGQGYSDCCFIPWPQSDCMSSHYGRYSF